MSGRGYPGEPATCPARVLLVVGAGQVDSTADALRRLRLAAEEDRASGAAARWFDRYAGPGETLLEVLVRHVDGPWLIHTLSHLASALSLGWVLDIMDAPTLIIHERGGNASDARGEPPYVTLLDQLLRLRTAGACGIPVVGPALAN